MAADAEPAIAKDFRSGEHADSGLEHGPDALQSKMLEKLEVRVCQRAQPASSQSPHTSSLEDSNQLGRR